MVSLSSFKFLKDFKEGLRSEETMTNAKGSILL